MTPQNERSNREWVAALSGNLGTYERETAYHDLWGYLYRVIYNYLREYGKTIDTDLLSLAEDITQSAIMKMSISRLIERFSPDRASFLTYMKVVAQNNTRDYLRRHTDKRYHVIPSLELPDEDSERQNFAGIYSDAENPEKISKQQEMWETLQSCINNLPERQKRVFLMVMDEELSSDEAAKRLNTSVSVVHQLVYRARVNLRKCLEEKGFTAESIRDFAG